MTVSQLVARERARVSLAVTARGAAIALAAAAAVAGVAVWTLGDARWITRPLVPLITWMVVLVLLGGAAWWTRRYAARHASSARVATAIEQEHSLRAGSLRAAIEVANAGALGRRAADQAAARLSGGARALAPAMQRHEWRRGAVAGVIALLALVQLGAARAKAPDGWRALRHPVRAMTGSLLPPLQIINAPQYVMRGERLRVRVAAAERRELALHVRTTGAPWSTQSLEVQGGEATAELGPLDADVVLLATDGRSTSDTVHIRVTDRPFVGDVAIRATYPAYLGRAAEVIPVGEPARVPRGTLLTIRGRASTALARMALARDGGGGGDTLHLDTDDHTFGGRLTAMQSGRWTWLALGVQGPIADVPAPLELEVVPDSAPRIELLAPMRDTVVLPGAVVTLRGSASDDHGLASVVVRSWRTREGGQALPDVTHSISAGGSTQWNADEPLDLSSRGLEPGDEVHVVLVATDASPWRQSSTSREVVLRVPSRTEQRDSARSLADSTAAHAAALAQAAKQLAQKTADVARSRQAQSGSPDDQRSKSASNKAMSFQSAEQARAAAKDQQRLQEQVRQLQKDAQALQKQLEAAGAMDSSLSRQLREAQNMLRDAMTPEMQKLLEDVMKATQQLSPEDVRRALENLAQQQQKLKEQLERSAEMLKRAAMEGAMQTLKDEAKEIADKERANADSLSRGKNTASKQARDLGDRSRKLAENVDKLAKRMEKEKAEAAPDKLQSASQQAAKSAEAMKRAAQSTEPEHKVAEAAGQQKQLEQKQGDQKQGARKQSEAKQGDAKQGEAKQGEHGQKGEQQAGQKAQQGQDGEQGEQSKQGQHAKAEAARDAAEKMDDASKKLSEAREQQIQEWKKETTAELDKNIQETMQLARQQQDLAKQAAQGQSPGDVKSEQSALQQGVDKVGERLQKEAGKTSHVSAQSQGAMGDARRKVQDATQQLASASQQQEAAGAMQEAAQALTKAAAAMVKDRERAANAQSASGFSEMIQQMRDMAKQQGQINQQAMGLMPMPGAQPGAQQSDKARGLGQQQRGLAKKMDEAGQEDPSGKASDLAKEMRQIADALENNRLDRALAERQQRLFRRLLDAGLTLEKEEREDNGKRESKSATGEERLTPTNSDATGRAAVKYREPTWNELRGLSAEERRAVLEYFKRINAERP